MDVETRADASTFSSFLRVLRRRKWIALIPIVLVPAAALFFSLRQAPLYDASAAVYVNKQDLAAALTGITADQSLFSDEDRAAQTQADLAMTPEVASRTVKALGLKDMNAGDVLGEMDVTPRDTSDVLDVNAEDEDPVLAARLANEFARQFTVYRGELDTAGITRARHEVTSKLSQLEAAGKEKSPLYNSLAQKEQELATFETLQTQRASVVDTAEGAVKVSPKPRHSAILGLFLGIVLGVGLAFLVDALDTRVRSAAEIAEKLGLPLLARLPAPSRKLVKDDEIAMLAQPTGTQAEAFRMLRTNLDFSLVDRKARKILVTSAIEKEGKSTTTSNLAVALARAGRKVVLVDLDLRRPYLNRFFGLPGTPGITDVALGRVPLSESLARIDLGTGTLAARSGNGNNPTLNGAEQGTLHVLTSGPLPPDPGEFVGTKKLTGILDELAMSFDTVLIDSPPILRVGDAMTLSSAVDAMVIVTRLNVVRRPMLNELHRLLETAPTHVLGFVVAGSGSERNEGYGYGYTTGYGYGWDDDTSYTIAAPLPAEHETAGEPQ